MANPTSDNAAVDGAVQATPEWQGWVAENVLRGVQPPNIIRTMVEQGFDEPTAIREVTAALQHPYVQAAAAMGTAPAPGATTASTGSTRADKYAWILEVTRRAARLSSGFGSVPRLTKPSREEFLEGFYARNRPCVIDGDMDDWAALTKWGPEYLKEGRSELTVAVEVYRDADASSQVNPPRIGHEMPFGEFVDAVERGGDTNGLYMTAGTTASNATLLEDLWADIAYPEYLDPDHAIGKGLLWYGPAGTLTPIHHDLTNNLMAQVRGRKRVKLIAPYETADVYNDNNRYSPVDIENPDFSKHPDFERVTIMEVEIGPGEMLFVPAGWWHGVCSLDTSITFTFMNFVYETDFYSFYTTPGEIK